MLISVKLLTKYVIIIYALGLACEQALRIWVSEVSLARTLLPPAPLGFAARSHVLARLTSLAQIGELARRLL